MAAAGHPAAGGERGAPRLLQNYAAFDRMIYGEHLSARARLDNVLGSELAGLLCRALTRSPRQPAALAV